MIDIEESKSNVYKGPGMENSVVMLVSARIACKMAEIIKSFSRSQQQASDTMGIPQPELTKILNGHFQSVSEAKMLSLLLQLKGKAI